jgi:transposase
MVDTIPCCIVIQGATGGLPMSHQFWLDQELLKRIQHKFPKPRGVARSDDRTVLSGIIHVIRNGLRWRDAPAEYGPHKTLYNRFVRWSRLGVFARMFRELAEPGSDGETIMIDSTHLKAHRTAASLSKGGLEREPSASPQRSSSGYES